MQPTYYSRVAVIAGLLQRRTSGKLHVGTECVLRLRSFLPVSVIQRKNYS